MDTKFLSFRFLLVIVVQQAFTHKMVSSDDNEDIAKVQLDNLFNKSNPIVRPGVYGNATQVMIDFYVQSFGPLNEVEMEFDIDLDFRETWTDPRLTFDTTSASNVDRPIFIPASHVNRFWKPDVYFPNDKSGKVHDVTIPNKSIRIYSNGTVRFFTRMAIVVSCTMYLRTFPLDEQECYLKISTYSYDTQEIVLNWFDDDSIEIKDDLNLPQFYMDKPVQGDCNETYKTGDFSCLQATFKLHRKVGFFVLQTYIPSILIVMLSWVAFWINKNSEPARIALGVTTVLTMTTQLTTSRSNAMRVSYPKAMDVWYSVCMLFVFAALIEYALVNVSVRTEKKNEQNASDCDMEKQTPDNVDGPIIGRLSRWRRRFNQWKASMSSKSIDHISRRLFPAAYFLFNLIYWLVYTNIPSKAESE